jgi:hypothetical protein
LADLAKAGNDVRSLVPNASPDLVGLSTFTRLLVRLSCICLPLIPTVMLLPGFAVAATPLSPDSLGVNFTGFPPDLATASAAGVGLAREEVIAGSNIDEIVQLTAAAHLRLYPMLGLPRSQGAEADASAMAAFVTSFAQRFGPGGTFWAQHPELPYLPVESYEIGNEPDITPTDPADETSLHYADPADYAEVYEAARTALHQVDPSAQAVVGGMLDSGSIGLDQAERYLAAIGPIDAVGYHPYLYDVTTMEQDTLALRAWLDASGHATVPLDINEFGAPVSLSDWGRQTAQYTEWALCTPALDVEDVQAFWWGAIPSADTDPWFPMVTSELSTTSLGAAYLAEVQRLTSQGCPSVAAAMAPPPRSRTGGTSRGSTNTLGQAHGPLRRHHRSKRARPRHPRHSHSHRRGSRDRDRQRILATRTSGGRHTSVDGSRRSRVQKRPVAP